MTTTREPVTHELKTWPDYFWPLVHGEKTFDLRLNDRDFQVGDLVKFLEWDPESKTATGMVEVRRITYILRGPFFNPDHSESWSGLREGWAILALSRR
jgi:hypothetical protein